MGRQGQFAGCVGRVGVAGRGRCHAQTAAAASGVSGAEACKKPHQEKGPAETMWNNLNTRITGYVIRGYIKTGDGWFTGALELRSRAPRRSRVTATRRHAPAHPARSGAGRARCRARVLQGHATRPHCGAAGPCWANRTKPGLGSCSGGAAGPSPGCIELVSDPYCGAAGPGPGCNGLLWEPYGSLACGGTRKVTDVVCSRC